MVLLWAGQSHGQTLTVKWVLRVLTAKWSRSDRLTVGGVVWLSGQLSVMRCVDSSATRVEVAVTQQFLPGASQHTGAVKKRKKKKFCCCSLSVKNISRT